MKIAGLNRWEPVVDGVPDSQWAADGTAGAYWVLILI
jgi:hypothetical protein